MRLFWRAISAINIPLVIYFVYGSTANFLFRCPIASLYISKEPRGYGNRSSPRIMDNGPAIRKLLRFPQVQSEHERTLVLYLHYTFTIVLYIYITQWFSYYTLMQSYYNKHHEIQTQRGSRSTQKEPNIACTYWHLFCQNIAGSTPVLMFLNIQH